MVETRKKIKVKKSLSSMDIAAMVREYQSLIGAFIKKAFQPAREIIVLRVNLPEGRKDLVIGTGKMFYFTDKGPDNPPLPTGFAMMLRKYITNGRIVSIEQQEFDRVIRIGVQKEELFELIIEGFGDGNVILVKDGKIIQPLISKTWRHRRIRAGAEYVIPPSLENPFKIDSEKFMDILGESEKDVVRTLAMGVNLGGTYAEEVCLVSGIEKGRDCSGLLYEEKNNLFTTMKTVIAFLDEPRPGIVYSDEAPVDVLPFPLTKYQNEKYVGKENFNSAVEIFFTLLDRPKKTGGEVGAEGVGSGVEGEAGSEGEIGITREGAESVVVMNPAIARIQRTIDQQKETIDVLGKKIGIGKEKAERLFHRYQEFEKAIENIKTFGEKFGWKEMALKLNENPKVEQIDLEKKWIVFKDEPTNIRLYFMESVNENAQRYYEESSRARDKMEGAKNALEDSVKKLAKARKEKVKEIQRTRIERKHFWFEKYRWFITSQGNIIIGGKDARSNDRVVKKYLKDRDRYSHAEIHGAPSLVIKHLNEEEFEEETLEEACTYAACFSRAWRAGIGSVEAYWVTADQVSKTPVAGEFLAKGAFMIRGRRNRYSAPLRLAIGKIEYEGVEMIMCGPEASLKKRTSSYIVFEPGEMPKNSFATKLARLWNVANEEILSIIPGDVVVRSHAGVDWNSDQ